MKTRKVFYWLKFTEDFVWECRTVCHVHGAAGNVGSLACHECKYFVSDNYIEAEHCGVIECKGVENRRDSSPAVEFPNQKS